MHKNADSANPSVFSQKLVRRPPQVNQEFGKTCCDFQPIRGRIEVTTGFANRRGYKRVLVPWARHEPWNATATRRPCIGVGLVVGSTMKKCHLCKKKGAYLFVWKFDIYIYTCVFHPLYLEFPNILYYISYVIRCNIYMIYYLSLYLYIYILYTICNI